MKKTDLGISGFRDERDGLLLLLFVFQLFADLLHLKHALHDKLVFALLVRMALVLALPWKVKLSLTAFVERNKEMCALISVG